MKNCTDARRLGLGAGLLALVALGWMLTGAAAGPEEHGLPTDWSHQHMIFSQPGTSEEAARVGEDPRYWQQWARENVVRTLRDGEAGSFVGGFTESGSGGAWSESLGSGGSVGAGNYPAKYSFQITTANCGNATTPDYVVYATGLESSSSQASIVAYDNLYSGCTGTVPQVYWAYDTSGQILTSPTISGDGTQVAFVQTNAGLEGTLVLLKWAASTTETVGGPMTLTPVANAAYRNCTAPCMTTIILKNNLGVPTDDRTSSVFPDYTHDVIWVGGAVGWLHKISGVFRGNPAEVTTGGFPAQMTQGSQLSSPVYDFASGNVFVGDYSGYFYRVSATGGVTASGQVDHGAGLVAGPIVDGTAGKAWVFASSDGSTNCVGNTPCAGVFEFTLAFGAGTTGNEAIVGASVVGPPNPAPLYEGGFDSTYKASGNATGNLYVCGNTGGPPILYQVPVAAGLLGTVVAGPVVATVTTGCSPVIDIPNPNATGGTNEWIYASAQTNGSGNSCGTSGCAMNFVVQPWIASHAYVVGQEVVDTHFQIQVVDKAGTSKATAPTWSTTLGATTDDNTVHWLDQGPQSGAHAVWQASHGYAVNAEIVDSNGNIELCTTAGTSRTAALGHPTWETTVNLVTADNTVRWRNVGAIATASVAAAGGTSGIIMDNVVGSGTLAGASQVYFSTQSNQTCGTAGTVGCAMQASQSALE